MAPGPPLGPTVEEQALQVVTRDYQAGVSQAAAAVSADSAAQARDEAAVAAETADVHAANGAVLAARQDLALASRARTASAVTARRAAAVYGDDQSRLRAIGLALYMGAPNAVPILMAKLAVGAPSTPIAQETGEAEDSLAIAEALTGARVGHDAAWAGATSKQAAARGAQVVQATGVLGAARTRARQDARTLTADQAEVAVDAGRLKVDQARLAAANQAEQVMVAAFTPAPASSPEALAGPSILGLPALSAAQLSGWFAESGDLDLTRARISELVGWYLSNGRLEGVRGDLAFAQAIVETGGFSSADAVLHNNFAGIGHCDSCAAGLDFPGPEAGVIGQLELLRTYADPGVTELPQPLALASLAPTSQAERGCCGTWTALSGVWASNVDYGQEILGVYSSMLDYALHTAPEAPPIAPPTPPGGSAGPVVASA